MRLALRSTEAERMDTDCVDYDDYRRCLRDLSRVNKAFFDLNGYVSLVFAACAITEALR